MNDGPSHMIVGGHLEKIGQWGVRDVRTFPMKVRRGYGGPSSVRRSVIEVSFYHLVTELGIPQSTPVTQTEYRMSTYMFLTKIPSKLAMLKHQFLEL